MTYDTPLNPEQEAQYQAWRSTLPRDLQNEGDYDLRGAFLDSVKADGRLHMTDKFKKPNHITFSQGSQYSTPQAPGGRWDETSLPNPNGGNQHIFWASPENLKYHKLNDLARYFQQYEQGNTFVAPISYNLPRGR